MSQQQEEAGRVSAIQLAGAIGVTPRAVKKRAAAESWTYAEEPGRGGQKRLYPIHSLPLDVQTALAPTLLGAVPAGVQVKADSERASPDSQAEQLAAYYESRPEKLKAEAAGRLALA